MKSFQSNYILRLLQPRAVIFGVAFFNFLWLYWETFDTMAGRGIAPAWYSTKDFPVAQFLLLVASLLLFIPRIWSYSVSVLTSGYFAISWTLTFIDWFRTTDFSLSYRMEIILSSYFGNPFQIWESQIIIVVLIFLISFCYFIKEFPHLKIKTSRK
jgi:hypothetical protein